MATLKQWNYEVSIWTLQDSFITVLKPSNMENKGQLENEDFVIKNDGTLEFSFSIPTWLYLDGERMPNPIWFDSYHGDGIKAILVKNMTKLKVTFNKGRDEEKTFELLITNCEESHENDNVYYNVQSEGMAFHELGKVGYKISLTQDLYDPLHKEWFEGDQAGKEPAANLDFWLQTGMGLEMLPGVEEVDEAIKLVERQHALCSNVKDRGSEINSLYRIDQTLIAIRDAGIISRKAFPYYEVLSSYVTQYEGLVNKDDSKAKGVIDALNAVIAAPKKVDRNKWYYIIDMDWSAYDSSRDRRKIYEEEYTKSWGYDSETNKFSAGDIEKAREKWRNEQIKLEESNKYNLTQNLAEIFGVFCRYEYIYDENYYIVGRKIIFYNNFAREQENGYLSLTYPYTASKISRTQETTDLVTKMYVKPVDNEHSLSGLSTIVDVGANKMREDYVMNFDYLKLIGTISDEQYAEIENYEGKIRKWNDKIADIQTKLNEHQQKLIDLQAEEQTLTDSVALSQKQLDSANDLLKSLQASQKDRDPEATDGYITIGDSSPRSAVAIKDAEKAGYYTVSLKDLGINYETFKLYLSFTPVPEIEGAYLSEQVTTVPTRDDYGNLISVTFYSDKAESAVAGKLVYATYKYLPELYTKEVIKIWGSRKYQDEERLKILQMPLEDVYADTAILNTDSIPYQQKQIEDLTAELAEQMEGKAATIAKFEAMMGPALREGFWQPEGYTDGGDRYVDTLNFTEEGKQTGVSGFTELIWDEEVKFAEQDEKSWYYEGVEKKIIQYPVVLLGSDNNVKYAAKHVDDLSFVYYDYIVPTENPDINTIRNLKVGSGAQYAFRKTNRGTLLLLLLTGAKSGITIQDGEAHFPADDYWNSTNPNIASKIGVYTTKVENKNIKVSITDSRTFSPPDLTYIGPTLQSEETEGIIKLVYPRIKVSSPFLKTTTDQLIIKYGNDILEQFKDYTVMAYNNEYYITIKPHALVRNGSSASFNDKDFQISFALSNADTSIYLDSLQVLKENAYPRVSYDVEPGVMDESFLYTAYDRLNQIVNINDFELMLENVQGYISELHINPDKMWETTFEVKNYRNKFEDLFSSIVAQTEEMKKSAYSIGLAANGFNTDGTISADTLSQSLSNNFNIFQAYLESGFDDSTIVRNQLQSIWDEAGAIINDAAHTLYGAHMTTVKNAAYLASFREDVKSALTPSYYTGSQPPTDFKPGDIWSDGVNTYIATTFEGFTKTYDGTLAAIRGANVMYDAQAGVVEITGENNIDIKSGGTLYLAADKTVDIVGNNRVNIGGREICIGAAEIKKEEGGSYATTTSGIHLVTSVVIKADRTKEIGSQNEGTEWNNENKTVEELSRSASSQLHITPLGIEMASANGIIIKSGAGIDIKSTSDENASVVQIDKDKGVWIGGKSVALYGGDMVGEGIDENGNGATVELDSEHLLLGFSNIGTADTSAIELNDKYVIIAAGDKVTSLQGTVGNPTGEQISFTNSLVGAKFTKDSIGFATNSTSGNTTLRNVIIMNSEGISIGSAAQGTNPQAAGSYIKISPKKLDFGSMADLYVNTNNVKLQTNASASDGSNTILAVGTNLQYDNKKIDTGTKGTDLESWAADEDTIGLVYNSSGLYVAGNIYAKDGIFNGTVYAAAGEFTGTIKSGSIITGTLQTDELKVKANASGTAQTWANYLNNVDLVGNTSLQNTYATQSEYTNLSGRVSNVIDGDMALAFKLSSTNAVASLGNKYGLVIVSDSQLSGNKATSNTISNPNNIPKKNYSKGTTYKITEAGIYAGHYGKENEFLVAVEDGPTAGNTIINSHWQVFSKEMIGSYPYFRATNDAMGFFYTSIIPSADGNDGYGKDLGKNTVASALYYEHGDLALRGNIYARIGWLGYTSDDDGFIIGPGSLESADGTIILKTAKTTALLAGKANDSNYKATASFVLKDKESNTVLKFEEGNLSITGAVTATEFHSENGIISLNSIAGMNSGEETLSNTLTNLDSKAEGSKITKVESKYFATTRVMSNNEIKSSSLVWSDTAQAAKTEASIADGVAYYLWTRTTTSYGAGNSDSAYSTSYVGADGATGPQGQKGDKGDTGNYVTAIRNIYYLTKQTSVSAPSSPAQIDPSTPPTTDQWHASMPEYVNGYTYWRCEEYTWNENIDDDKYSYSTPYPDYGITTANRTATTASADARAARDVTDPIDSSGLEFNKSWGGKTWDVALLSAAHYTEETDPDKKYGGILIGANQGIWIAKGNAYGDGAAIAIDSSGIGMNAASITLTAEENGNTSVLSLSGGGIDLGTRGDIIMGGGNISLTGGSIILENNDDEVFMLSNAGINMKGTEISLGDPSGDNAVTINSTGVTIPSQANITQLNASEYYNAADNKWYRLADLLSNKKINVGSNVPTSEDCGPGEIYLRYQTAVTPSTLTVNKSSFENNEYHSMGNVRSNATMYFFNEVDGASSIQPDGGQYTYTITINGLEKTVSTSRFSLQAQINIGTNKDSTDTSTVSSSSVVEINFSGSNSYSSQINFTITSSINYFSQSSFSVYILNKVDGTNWQDTNLRPKPKSIIVTMAGASNNNTNSTGPQLCEVYYYPTGNE